jgi:rubredoxin
MKHQCSFLYIDEDGHTHCDHRGNDKDACASWACPRNEDRSEVLNNT